MTTPLLNGRRHPGRGGVEWNRVRARVLASSQTCWVCGGYIDLNTDPKSKWAPTVDHLYTIKAMQHFSAAEQKRLALDESLLRPAHRSCNTRRTARRRRPLRTTTGVSNPSRDW